MNADTASFALYRPCRLCGRDCGVDRLTNSRGFCGEGQELKVASATIHGGEEPPIVGRGGSGTVFFTGCTLGCAFCQNHQISQRSVGKSVSYSEFSAICLALQAEGAENINLVTGSHFAPSIAYGLTEARQAGLELPALWNTSAYESLSAIDIVAPNVTVFLPDFKTLSPDWANRWFRAPDYPETAAAAILRMLEHAPLRFAPARSSSLLGGTDLGGLVESADDGRTATTSDDIEVIVSGVVMRHLVMPGRLDDTRAILRWYADHLAGKALLSLMTQYTPIPTLASAATAASAPDRYLSEAEYEAVLELLDEFSIEDGFYQELVRSDDWIPDFDLLNPFGSALSRPVWHWRSGFL